MRRWSSRLVPSRGGTGSADGQFSAPGRGGFPAAVAHADATAEGWEPIIANPGSGSGSAGGRFKSVFASGRQPKGLKEEVENESL